MRAWAQAAHLSVAPRVKCAQLVRERSATSSAAILKVLAQVRQARAEGAGGQLRAQLRETLINRRAHGREAHELGEPPALRGGDEIAHADTLEARALRRSGLDVRGHPEVDQERRRTRPERRQRRLPEQRLPAPGGEHHGAHGGRIAAKILQRLRFSAEGMRQLRRRLRRAVDDEQWQLRAAE